jgi:hypothetical protein
MISASQCARDWAARGGLLDDALELGLGHVAPSPVLLQGDLALEVAACDGPVAVAAVEVSVNTVLSSEPVRQALIRQITAGHHDLVVMVLVGAARYARCCSAA